MNPMNRNRAVLMALSLSLVLPLSSVLTGCGSKVQADATAED